VTRGSDLQPVLELADRVQLVDIVRVDHRGRRGMPMLPPHRPAVEARQCLLTLPVVGEATQPDEVVDTIDIAELADDPDADGFLRLDELPIEQLDQLISPPPLQ